MKYKINLKFLFCGAKTGNGTDVLHTSVVFSPILCVRYELNDPNLPHAGTRTSTVDDSIVGAGLYKKAGTKLSIPNNIHTKK